MSQETVFLTFVSGLPYEIHKCIHNLKSINFLLKSYYDILLSNPLNDDVGFLGHPV